MLPRRRVLGRRQLTAITTPSNGESVAFHTRLGMRLVGEPGPDSIPGVGDDSEPGQDCVVMVMAVWNGKENACAHRR